MKKYLIPISLSLFTAFMAVNTAFGQADPLIPCEGTPESPCGWDQAMKLVDNSILFFLKYLVLPAAVIVIAYGGFLYLTSGGNAAKRKQANGMFTKLFIGLFFCLAAWAIVEIILSTFGYDTTLFSPVVSGVSAIYYI